MIAPDLSRVLITGADGMIGSYIDFGVKTTRKDLDILDQAAVIRYVRELKPSMIIHLAAATDMKRCETDPEHAFSVNTIGTYHIARAARETGAGLVYLSTSRIFDGKKKGPYTELDIPNPVGAYARSKYAGELVVEELVPDHIIIRTSWVFGGGPQRDNKFYGNVIRQLGGNQISAIDDVLGSPTSAKDLVEAIKELIAHEKRGIFHISNSDTATRYDIVRFISKHVGASTEVLGVPQKHFASGTPLPDNESVTSAVDLRSWRSALAEYLDIEWAAYLRNEKILS
jgi:dTDP-4-dehydrorhamnose reductase